MKGFVERKLSIPALINDKSMVFARFSVRELGRKLGTSGGFVTYVDKILESELNGQ